MPHLSCSTPDTPSSTQLTEIFLTNSEEAPHPPLVIGLCLPSWQLQGPPFRLGWTQAWLRLGACTGKPQAHRRRYVQLNWDLKRSTLPPVLVVKRMQPAADKVRTQAGHPSRCSLHEAMQLRVNTPPRAMTTRKKQGINFEVVVVGWSGLDYFLLLLLLLPSSASSSPASSPTTWKQRKQ